MNGFIVRTDISGPIRFDFYSAQAPLTAAAFEAILPFSRKFFHARVSGQEIWIDDAPAMDIIQENVSVFTIPGEIVIGPVMPLRNRICGCIGIFYGEGKLLDGGNIFGKVKEEDLQKLKMLGDKIWREGGMELFFEKAD